MNPTVHFLVAYPEILLCSLGFLAGAIWLCWRPYCRKAGLLVLASGFGLIGPPQATITLGWLSRLREWRLDHYVFRLDGLLGFEPSFWLGQLLHAHRWLYLLAAFSYDVLPAVYVGIFAVYLIWRSVRESAEIAAAFTLNLFAALPIYLLFPVCGPRYAFASFPLFVPPHVECTPILLSAPPNGVPSVHFSSALLILWFLRRWRAGRLFGVAFLGLTVLATLGGGEHYLFDLVIAVPYAIMVGRIAKRLTWTRSISDRSLVGDREEVGEDQGSTSKPAILSATQRH